MLAKAAGRAGWVIATCTCAATDRAEPVEQVGRVEADRDVVAGQRGLERLRGLGLLAVAGLEGDLAVGEAQPDRGVAAGDQRDPLDRRRSGQPISTWALISDVLGKSWRTLGNAPSISRVVVRR